MNSTIAVSKSSESMSEYLVLQHVHQWGMLPLQSLRGARAPAQRPLSDLSQQPLQETGRGFLGRHKTNQTPVNLPNRKTNVCVIAGAPFPPPPVKSHIYKTKSITELCVMEHLSLSGCRLNTTVPDQAISWQFRSSKAFNILSSHRERLHHKQLNSAWHLSRRYEMQKSQVLAEGAACRHSLGMEGDSAQSVLTNEHCTCCTRNAQGTGQFFLSISILSSSSARNKVAIATETLKKKLA